MKSTILLLICGLTMVVSSCTNSADPGSTTTGGAVVPKTGSTFIMRSIYFDTTGGTSTSIDTLLEFDTIKSNNVVWNGRTVSYMSSTGYDSTGTVIESNGDVSFYFGVFPLGLNNTDTPADFGWIRLPFGSHASTVLRTIDTALSSVPNEQAHVVVSVSYLGQGSVTVGKESLPVSIARFTIEKTLTDGTQTVYSTIQQDISFSPQIGYIVKDDLFKSTTPASLDENFAATQILQSYSLK